MGSKGVRELYVLLPQKLILFGEEGGKKRYPTNESHVVL